VAYGARLESELGATPRGFKSRILRSGLLTFGRLLMRLELDLTQSTVIDHVEPWAVLPSSYEFFDRVPVADTDEPFPRRQISLAPYPKHPQAGSHQLSDLLRLASDALVTPYDNQPAGSYGRYPDWI
jgi:hypothetical protein